jgi:chemotaxis methyl-accepting protein methylase
LNLTAEEEDFLKSFATGLTGHSFAVQSNLETVFRNVKNLMTKAGCGCLADYLAFAIENDSALDDLISAFTIHTTNWFREAPHFDILSKDLREKLTGRPVPTKVKILIAACSTGQEAYSVAFTCLQVMNTMGVRHELEITAFDLDPVSVKKAQFAIYSNSELRTIPKEYHGYLKTLDKDNFKISDEAQRVCSFKVGNLLKLSESQYYDYIFCRNALIYFTVEKISEIVKNLSLQLAPSGKLILGHSDNLVSLPDRMKPMRNNIYEFTAGTKAETKANTSSRVETKRATTAAAQTFRSCDAILIGSSTGGTTALVDLLGNLNISLPPVVVVQHISHQFSQDFAQRLASASNLAFDYEHGNKTLQRNSLYMSVGDYHLGMKGRRGDLKLYKSDEPPLKSHRPAVDFLFHSASQLSDVKFLCILLTGMGEDGARGLLALKKAGHFTASQDEVSSTVYGMPKAAAELGASQFIGNIGELRKLLTDTFAVANDRSFDKKPA